MSLVRGLSPVLPALSVAPVACTVCCFRRVGGVPCFLSLSLWDPMGRLSCPPSSLTAKSPSCPPATPSFVLFLGQLSHPCGRCRPPLSPAGLSATSEVSHGGNVTPWKPANAATKSCAPGAAVSALGTARNVARASFPPHPAHWPFPPPYSGVLALRIKREALKVVCGWLGRDQAAVLGGPHLSVSGAFL